MKGNLTLDQRGRVAEKIMELGNIGIGALLFGQAFSGFPFNFILGLIGICVLTLTYVTGIKIMRGGG